MKEKKRMGTTAALMWRIGALALALWLGAMAYITAAAARQLRDKWAEHAEHDSQQSYRYDSGADLIHQFGWIPMEYLDLPLYRGLFEDHMDAAHNCRINQYHFTEAGELTVGDGSYLSCEVVPMSEPMSLTAGDSVYVKTDEIPELAPLAQSDTPSDVTTVLWVTGYFDGNEMVPVKAYSSTYDSYYHIFDHAELEWTLLFDNTQGETHSLVEFYAYELEAGTQTGESVLLDGREFSSLQELAEETCRELREGQQEYADIGNYTSESIWERVYVATGWCGERNCDLNLKMTGQETEDGQQNAYCVTIARGYPMRSAMLRLIPMYVISLHMVALLVLVLWRRVKKSLSDPLNHILRYGKADYALLPGTYESRFREPYQLEQGYEQMQKDLHALRQENQQLKAKLSYAENAEENRRRMVSDITHELKTPLAVIHSYAEGLSEDIAAHKRQKYLDVILDETEQMDGMVLEMLDLSRLEAGRLKLRQDRFSLLGLTKQVMEKLERLVQERELQVEYNMCYDFDILADEGRIEQVITNLASNAVKYTTGGGRIAISVLQGRGRCHFIISNECAPLPQETLDHIWDSFFRSDASRKTKGTGLGLAITKAIVELHGGSCEAANTQTGVEFRFTLPQ